MLTHPLLTEVVPNLWIGPYPFQLPLPDVPILPDKLVLCAEEPLSIEEKITQVHCIRAPLSPNVLTPEDRQTAVQVGRAVGGWLRRNKSVLVTCTTGKNRAALVAAIALMTYGLPSAQAIATVRAAASDALSESFVRMLRRLEDARDLHISISL